MHTVRFTFKVDLECYYLPPFFVMETSIPAVIVSHHLTTVFHPLLSLCRTASVTGHATLPLKGRQWFPLAVRVKAKVPTVIYGVLYDLVPPNHLHDLYLLQISPSITPF